MTVEEAEIYVFVRWIEFGMEGWGERKSYQHIRSDYILTDIVIIQYNLIYHQKQDYRIYTFMCKYYIGKINEYIYT